MWLGKLTALDMTPLGWLGRKTSTQTIYLSILPSTHLPQTCAPTPPSEPSAQSSLSAWRNFAPLVIQNTAREDFDQTVRMRRLIWIFAGRKRPEVGFLTFRLNSLWKKDRETYSRLAYSVGRCTSPNITSCLAFRQRLHVHHATILCTLPTLLDRFFKRE